MDSDIYAGSNFGPPPVAVPTLYKDVRDATVADFKGFDAVIHLAGLSNDPLGNLDPLLTYAINHEASAQLAALAKQAGVPRFLFSSSCSTYGAAGDAPIDEQATFNPVTPYGHSKVLAERDIGALADARFTPIFLRNGTAYGVSSRLRFDLVLNNLVAWAYTTGRIYLKSDGTPWRPIVHIEDISRAFIALMQAPRELVHNQAFNVGQTTENYRMSELAELVHQVVPNTEIEYADDAGPDKRCYRVDCNRIARLIPAFKPQWTALRGAHELYEVYQQVGLKLEDFEGPRYKRIDHIKQLLHSERLDASLRWREQQAVGAA
jgi:nucleoside-diphosphate-sugar epimerase